MIGQIIDITGQRFGNLIAIEIENIDERGEKLWKCKCDCGNFVAVRSYSLRAGLTKSCGCYNKEKLSGRRNKVNDDYFNVPNVENSYWAGFIAADGNITEFENESWQKRLTISISTKDKEHLKKFVNSVKFMGNVRTYIFENKSDYVSIQITSNKLCDDLKKNFNIIPRKSLSLISPNLKDELNILSFIKGYIDGDGSIGKYKNCERINIVGTENLLNWIVKSFKNILNVDISKPKSKDNVFYINITGEKCRKVIQIMNQINTPCLYRKWEPVI